MIKLYKKIDGQLHYWECWEASKREGIIHWGPLGERGDDKTIKVGFLSNCSKPLQEEIKVKLEEGYCEIDFDDFVPIEIEYAIEGMGTEDDLNKRHSLEERLGETLGWTGLGSCDGGSIGSGTMEAGCYVVDFDLAKKVIEDDLKDTEYANYTRIFNPEA